MAEPRRTGNIPTSSQLRSRQPSQQDYDDVLLNRYRIMNARGTGGFGTVLTCWDTRLQRRVAIKRMPLAGTQATATVAEALAEARTSSMLAHPNIVTVYDFEVDGTFAYLVMEYVDGLNLAELLARVEGGTLTHDEAACLVQSVAAALGYAHENGVLHMDIKPTNIMIDHSGTVKLCDFGMATLASAAGYGGARGGTVGYMPPEQIEGTLVDERTDIFSLAVVVWQALLGSTPFAAPTAERSLALINRGPAKRPSKLDPTLAGMAEEALLGALAPVASARIPSVETLAKELVFALGEPAAGAESFRDLLAQTADAADDPQDWEGERLPLGISYPWLPGAFVRVLAAVCSALAAFRVMPFVFPGVSSAPLIALAVCAAAAGLWPPLGCALVAAAACVAVTTHATTAAPLLLAIVCAIAFALWWSTCATRSPLSTPAVLLPALTASPLPAVAVAGGGLAPLPATLTACLGWFVGRMWPTAAAMGFSLDGLVDSLLAPLVSPSALVSLAGVACAAFVCSALTNWGTATSYDVAGQVMGAVTLVGFQLLSARMENGGTWADPSWENTGIAVVLCVLVCIACVLRGPREADAQE